MSDLRSYSNRSEGPTVDALALKLTGDTSLESDLRRTQEVEITVRGIVIGHTFEDKRDKNGDIVQTVKAAKVKVDELVEIQVLTVPRRMKGQTAMPMDGTGADGEDLGEVVEPIIDATVVGELPPGPRPDGVDENGEVRRHAWTDPDGDGLQYCTACGYADSAVSESHACSGKHGVLGAALARAEPEVEESMIDRHPQIPEDAWRELNVEQKLDVAARMDKITARQNTIAEARNQTDVDAAQAHLDTAVAALGDDYGITLLPAEVIEKADEALPADEAPPAPVVPGGPAVTAAELQRRRRYLLAKQGMPAEMEQARQEELEEIDRRLRPRTPA